MPTTFRAKKETPLLRQADEGSEKLGSVKKDQIFVGDLKDNFIKTTITAISPEPGFVVFIPDSAKVTTPEPLTAASFGQFCDLVTQAAREVGADRDYLMAVAYDGTKNLTAVGDQTTPKAGPFQFTEEAWKAALAGVAKGGEFTEIDRLNWLQQPKVAALLAKEAAEKFKTEFDRLPVFKELYFLQLVGDAALAALKTPAAKCSEAIAGSPAAGTYAAEIKAGTSTVNEALTALQKRLEAAYVEALKVIDLQPPENRFLRVSVGDPPWMAVAREQLARGVKEDPGDRNNEEIAAYFQAINAHVGTVPGQTVHWCGAFVGYCIKTCGVAAAAAKVAPEAVGADYWLTWDPIPDNQSPPVGAIVIFPGEHVGFLADGSTDTKLKILGGNQSDSVSIVSRDRAGAQFRWFAGISRVSAPAVPAGQNAFVTLAPQIMKMLLKDFPELEQNDIYAAAILGNLGHECAGFTQFTELNPIHEGPPGVGWAQWTRTRGTEFRNFLAGKPIDDFESNYAFLKHELQNTHHKRAIAAMKKESDLFGAVVAFEKIFEVAHPDFKHYDKRVNYGQIALSEFRKTA